MKNKFLIFVVLLGVCSFSAAVIAGECRELLRPLMLQTDLDKSRLGEVREVCVAEAAAGDADAVYQSSLFYLGLLEWSPDQAIPLIRSSAAQGVPEAQYWLAWQYDEGPLLPDDAELALQWYEVAGDGEHRLALERLARAYEYGELGLAPNIEKAILLRARAERCKDQASAFPRQSGNLL
jgi:TPR repeat protein